MFDYDNFIKYIFMFLYSSLKIKEVIYLYAAKYLVVDLKKTTTSPFSTPSAPAKKLTLKTQQNDASDDLNVVQIQKFTIHIIMENTKSAY